MSKTNYRTTYGLYLPFSDFGFPLLSCDKIWMTGATIRTRIASTVRGKLAAVYKAFLKLMMGRPTGPDFRDGVYLPLPPGASTSNCQAAHIAGRSGCSSAGIALERVKWNEGLLRLLKSCSSTEPSAARPHRVSYAVVRVRLQQVQTVVRRNAPWHPPAVGGGSSIRRHGEAGRFERRVWFQPC